MPTEKFNFDLKLPSAPDPRLEAQLHGELLKIYSSMRILAHQLGGGNLFSVSTYSPPVIAGLAGGTIKVSLRYLNLDTLFVNFFLSGTSNSTVFSFKLPEVSAIDLSVPLGTTIDNGVVLTVPGALALAAGSDVVTFSKDVAGAAWTASNTKGVAGQFIYNFNTGD